MDRIGFVRSWHRGRVTAYRWRFPVKDLCKCKCELPGGGGLVSGTLGAHDQLCAYRYVEGAGRTQVGEVHRHVLQRVLSHVHGRVRVCVGGCLLSFFYLTDVQFGVVMVVQCRHFVNIPPKCVQFQSQWNAPTHNLEAPLERT